MQACGARLFSAALHCNGHTLSGDIEPLNAWRSHSDKVNFGQNLGDACDM
jgi:hypothetical protein